MTTKPSYRNLIWHDTSFFVHHSCDKMHHSTLIITNVIMKAMVSIPSHGLLSLQFMRIYMVFGRINTLTLTSTNNAQAKTQ